MMAESYGTPPDELLGANLSPAESFWFNSDVWAARQIFEQRHKNENGNASGLAHTSEQQQMANEQQQRAAQAEAMKEAGQMAPEVEEQMQALNQIQEQRQVQDGGEF